MSFFSYFNLYHVRSAAHAFIGRQCTRSVESDNSTDFVWHSENVSIACKMTILYTNSSRGWYVALTTATIYSSSKIAREPTFLFRILFAPSNCNYAISHLCLMEQRKREREYERKREREREPAKQRHFHIQHIQAHTHDTYSDRLLLQKQQYCTSTVPSAKLLWQKRKYSCIVFHMCI